MTVESVGGPAVGLSRPRTILRVLIAISLTIATGAALLLPTPAADAERFSGTAGDDRIIGTELRDRISARGGDDVVSALGGKDFVHGGPGRDIIDLGGGADLGSGGPGNDVIRLGPNPVNQDVASGGDGSDRIFGGPGVHDHLRGGQGPDELHGRVGPDMLEGGSGLDKLHGERGDDFFVMNRGADTASGGRGNDEFDVIPDGHPDQIFCGPGTDTVIWEIRRETLDRVTGCERQLFF